MKKIITLFLGATLAFSLSACGTGANRATETAQTVSQTKSQNETSVQTTEETSAVTEPEEQTRKTLVVYFSRSGNTREMAEYIAKQTDGDIFEIIPKTPYPEDYTECTEVALAERDNNMRPEIKDLPDNIDEYNTVIIGYPIWWHTAPMIIGTFLESYDLTNIEVYPFTQSASMDEEQFENSMEFIRNCAGNGNVHDGLFTRASNTSDIDNYLSENGLLK
ncbi:MAG: flavodoxin [Oscillospiraceae bacterium]